MSQPSEPTREGGEAAPGLHTAFAPARAAGDPGSVLRAALEPADSERCARFDDGWLMHQTMTADQPDAADRGATCCVASAMIAVGSIGWLAQLAALAVMFIAIAACGGSQKPESTTPAKAAASGDPQSMTDRGDPDGFGSGNPDGRVRVPGSGGAASGAGGTASGASGASAASAAGTAGPAGAPASPASPGSEGPGNPPLSAEQISPTVTMPSYDPEPSVAKAQVDQHLQVARAALAAPTPDPDTALREARQALGIDAASVDAAAMVAFAYYHKKLYDTAELVLDDLFKREAAKQNANVYYVYGLIYDHTSRADQAVLSFKKAVEINPNHTSALVNLGVHQLRNSQYGEAVDLFERLTRQFGRTDAVTLTSLGSAYRGRAADYPAGPERDGNVRRAEAAYKRALQANNGYGPAYYNLGLLYLDNDPYPGLPDPLLRLNTAKGYFEQYKNMQGVDMKLYDDRMKDVTKAIKRAEKQQKKKGGGSEATPAAPPKAKGGAKRGGNP